MLQPAARTAFKAWASLERVSSAVVRVVVGKVLQRAKRVFPIANVVDFEILQGTFTVFSS